MRWLPGLDCWKLVAKSRTQARCCRTCARSRRPPLRKRLRPLQPYPAEPLKKGEYIVVANDLAKFKETYPDFKGRLFGPWDDAANMKLPNEGDVVNVKIDGEGDVSCAFGNEPPWPSLADGKGRTYQRTDLPEHGCG